MTNNTQPVKYELDNSGILHLAVLKLGRSNSFRLAISLKEKIQPQLLQEAVNAVTPRFPTLVAGIESGFFRHYVVPVREPPKIRPDIQPLAYMPPEEIKTCAIRVLYSGKQVIVECFHSLTDGYGGFAFFKALLAEYLRLAHGEDYAGEPEILHPAQGPQKEETVDSFLEYAADKGTPFANVTSYLPGAGEPDSPMHTVTGTFEVEQILAAAHEYGVSMTAFLTTVLAESVMQMQLRHHREGERLKPVQIMVPADLRRRFPSRTLRNFSLYALPRIRHEDLKLPFQELTQQIAEQLREQFSKEQLQAMISTNAALDRNWFLRRMPLAVKCFGLRVGYHFFGSRTSSLSLSNLGELRFPKRMQAHIEKVNVFLSARPTSPYNCGVISNNGKLTVCFSRCCAKAELEKIFFDRLRHLGCIPVVQVDGKNVSRV